MRIRLEPKKHDRFQKRQYRVAMGAPAGKRFTATVDGTHPDPRLNLANADDELPFPIDTCCCTLPRF